VVAGGGGRKPGSSPGDREHRALRTYGRRKGHRLSARQEALIATLLPEIVVPVAGEVPDPLAELFRPANVDRVWLEIGFGSGEHLVAQAGLRPGVGLIGCEPYVNGVARLLSEVEERGLANVRIHAGDARVLMAWLPAGSISRCFILFPDPWPKARHLKRRLITAAFLSGLARVMAPGGELRIATDIGDYARTTLLALRRSTDFAWLAESPIDWRERPDGWPATRYERKAVAAGRRCTYLRLQRRD